MAEIIKHVYRQGTDLAPTYIVEIGSERNKEFWDPWDVDLTWDKENKEWICNDGNTYKFSVSKQNQKWVNDLTNRCRTEVGKSSTPKEEEKKVERGTRVDELNSAFPGLNLSSDAGDFPLGMGCYD
jgi:hypothetical protein